MCILCNRDDDDFQCLTPCHKKKTDYFLKLTLTLKVPWVILKLFNRRKIGILDGYWFLCSPFLLSRSTQTAQVTAKFWSADSVQTDNLSGVNSASRPMSAGILSNWSQEGQVGTSLQICWILYRLAYKWAVITACEFESLTTHTGKESRPFLLSKYFKLLPTLRTLPHFKCSRKCSRLFLISFLYSLSSVTVRQKSVG